MCFQVNKHVSKLIMFPSYVVKLTITEKLYLDFSNFSKWTCLNLAFRQATNLSWKYFCIFLQSSLYRGTIIIFWKSSLKKYFLFSTNSAQKYTVWKLFPIIHITEEAYFCIFCENYTDDILEHHKNWSEIFFI